MAKSSTTTKTVGDRSFKGVAYLIKLLPSGTVFLFQFLSPLLTNRGQCHTTNKCLTAALLLFCTPSCCSSSFTDSYTSDGKVYHGVVTVNGLLRTFSSSDSNAKKRLSKYKLGFTDLVHGLLSLVAFAALAILKAKTVAMALPVAIGGVSSFVFMVFPNTRQGIGYAATETSESPV